MLSWLVGGFNPFEKYESQLATIIPNVWKNWKNKTCSKPPTSWFHFQALLTMIPVRSQ
jgi:hypothetical protein